MMLRDMLSAIAEYPWAFVGMVIGGAMLMGAVGTSISLMRQKR